MKMIDFLLAMDNNVQCPRPLFVGVTFYISSSKNIFITARAYKLMLLVFRGLLVQLGKVELQVLMEGW